MVLVIGRKNRKRINRLMPGGGDLQGTMIAPRLGMLALWSVTSILRGCSFL